MTGPEKKEEKNDRLSGWESLKMSRPLHHKNTYCVMGRRIKSSWAGQRAAVSIKIPPPKKYRKKKYYTDFVVYISHDDDIFRDSTVVIVVRMNND